MKSLHSPPGPSLIEALKLALAFRRGAIEGFAKLRAEYGDVVYVPSPIDAYVLFRPEHVAHVLQQKTYRKSRNYRELAFLLGQGLVTSEGGPWATERRRVAGAFRAEALEAYAEDVAITAHRWANALGRRHPERTSFDITAGIGPLTSALSCSFLFGGSDFDEALELRGAIDAASVAAVARIYAPVRLPRWVPTALHRRERQARRTLNALVEARLRAASGRNGAAANRSVLATLLAQQAEHADLSKEQLRDHLVTFLVAGQDTVEAGLNWFFYAIAQRPDLQERIRSEVRAGAANTRSACEELESLAFTRACLLETLRLYPPIPVIARTPMAQDEIGGFTIPAGAVVLCAVREMQRAPESWPAPSEFRPERFLGERCPRVGAERGYLAFGAGPRRCIGERLALLEMTAVAAAVLGAHELNLEPGFAPIARTTVAMKPHPGVRVTLRSSRGREAS